MGILDNFRNWLLQPLLQSDPRREDILTYRRYRRGEQKTFLRRRVGQVDDNLIINYTGLVINRSVAKLFGEGISFDLKDDADEKYINAVWQANKQAIFLRRLALMAAEAGTGYIKIIPDGAMSADGTIVPRLVAIDPMWVDITTNPEDWEQVTQYTIRYNYIDATGHEAARKQEITLVEGGAAWEVTDYLDTGRGWEMLEQTLWDYDFPPMLHYQNLPSPNSQYGVSDVSDDLIYLQDRVNFIASNMAKIIRIYAHPQRWGKRLGNTSKIDIGPDEMVSFDGLEAELNQLEQLGDLAGSQQFLNFLRQALFDIAQTVDIDSIGDKLGALTNFALKVLYSDEIAKLQSKRETLGEALIELNRRMLILSGKANADGGEVVWPELLTVNEVEQQQALQADLGMGIVSKETIAKLRGYNWQDEQERMQGEQAAGDNVGAAILRAFSSGAGVSRTAGGD